MCAIRTPSTRRPAALRVETGKALFPIKGLDGRTLPISPPGNRPVSTQTKWRARVERLVAVGGELQAVKEERERPLGDLEMMRERMDKTERDRDRLTYELDMHLRLPWWRRLFV
jgi:hypothetical protein